MRKKKSLITVVSLILGFGVICAALLKSNSPSKRSVFGRALRSMKGEYYIEQKANDLADDFRKIPSLSLNLQRWAHETMIRFQEGNLRGSNGSHLSWAESAFEMSPEETPDLIRTRWTETNRFGEIFPAISIVLQNGKPNYIIIDWLSWGIAVGEPEYRVSFGPTGTNQVIPGVYTYFIEK